MLTECQRGILQPSLKMFLVQHRCKWRCSVSIGVMLTNWLLERQEQIVRLIARAFPILVVIAKVDRKKIKFILVPVLIVQGTDTGTLLTSVIRGEPGLI